jgi:hypothetical protein
MSAHRSIAQLTLVGFVLALAFRLKAGCGGEQVDKREQ